MIWEGSTLGFSLAQRASTNVARASPIPATKKRAYMDNRRKEEETGALAMISVSTTTISGLFMNQWNRWYFL